MALLPPTSPEPVIWKIGQGETDAIGEFGQRHPPIVEQVFELDGDRHLSHRPFEVFAHARAFREHTRRHIARSTASQPLMEKPASF